MRIERLTISVRIAGVSCFPRIVALGLEVYRVPASVTCDGVTGERLPLGAVTGVLLSASIGVDGRCEAPDACVQTTGRSGG
jgi:hypothetical protein